MSRSIEDSLQAWNVRDLQTFKMIVLTLKLEGLTVEDAISYIESLASDAQKVIERKLESLKEWEVKARKCPECDKPLALGGIGTNLKGYQHQWFCVDPDCPFVEELGMTTVEEEKEKLEIKGFVEVGNERV